ncbi:Uncharacterised protein [Serratia rubidaea]|uniref:Uncharacterized protein n=1 Tax=Serratia rubidaea TaxID=61652 RepID=A0A3S4G782_SERRU|nr:Uncharacterised protein [Serratia rubidaea]
MLRGSALISTGSLTHTMKATMLLRYGVSSCLGHRQDFYLRGSRHFCPGENGGFPAPAVHSTAGKTRRPGAAVSRRDADGRFSCRLHAIPPPDSFTSTEMHPDWRRAAGTRMLPQQHTAESVQNHFPMATRVVLRRPLRQCAAAATMNVDQPQRFSPTTRDIKRIL